MRTIFFALIILFTSYYSGGQDNNYFFVFLNSNPDRSVLAPEEVRKIQEMHIANIDSLYKEGKLIAAGPFNGGGGILILVAQDIGKAWDLLNSDPAVQAKRFITELFPLRIDKGSLCWIEGESTMEEYTFVRLTPFPLPLEDSTQIINIINEHNEYIENRGDSIQILMEGYLGADAGRFIIFNSGETEKIDPIVQNDPYVLNLLHAYELKKIWIAGETFCIND